MKQMTVLINHQGNANQKHSEIPAILNQLEWLLLKWQKICDSMWEKKGTLLQFRECNLVLCSLLLWGTEWKFLKKLKIDVPIKAAIQFLSYI